MGPSFVVTLPGGIITVPTKLPVTAPKDRRCDTKQLLLESPMIKSATNYTSFSSDSKGPNSRTATAMASGHSSTRPTTFGTVRARYSWPDS